jgi:hypothetical protein
MACFDVVISAATSMAYKRFFRRPSGGHSGGENGADFAREAPLIALA